MTSPILKTKLFIPPVRERFISRPRLINLINEQIKQKVSFISAPAGYGKSTLLAEWASQSDLPVCWVSLDRSDNDPISFLSYLISSIQTIWDGLGDSIITALTSPGSPPLNYLLKSLINELLEYSSEFVLILDDLHHIENPEVYDILCYLADHQPSQMHIVIASRAELPFSCSQLRGHGELGELDIVDLRFSKEESITYLENQLKGKLSEADSLILIERTEGWIVGLHMAVLSIKSHKNAAKYVAEFSAHDRYITDYLLDEILLGLSDDIERFLIATSMFGKFTAQLCDSTLEINDSSEIIDTLVQTGMFIIPLDTTQTWYRYHHLFAELLQARLIKAKNYSVNSLHRKASDWFAAEGMLEESIAHVLEINDYPLAIQKIEKSLTQIMAQGQFRNYLYWLDSIPKEFLKEKPRLEIIKIFMLHEMGRYSERDLQLDSIDAILGPISEDIEGLNKGEIINHGIFAAIKAIISASSDLLLEETYYFAKIADEILPEDYSYWRTLALGAIPFMHRALGEYEKSVSGHQNMLKKTLAEGFTFQIFIAYSVITKEFLETNKLKLALVTCQKAIDLDKRQNPSLPFAKLTYLLMGELLYQSGQTDAAEEYIDKGLDHVVQHGEIYSIIDGYSTLIKIQIANGDYEQALALIKELKRIMSELAISKNTIKIINAWEAYVNIIFGSCKLATFWIEEENYDQLEGNYLFDLGSHSYVGIYRVSQTPIQVYSDFIKLTTAKVFICQNNFEPALDLIEGVLIRMSEGGNTQYQIDFLIVKAIILSKLQLRSESLLVIHKSIKLATKEGYIQIFLNEGNEVRDLLEQLKEQGAGDIEEQVFILQILEKIQKNTQSFSADIDGQFIKLTPREVEVLEMLSTGTSYSKAAEELSISRNTIKTHTKSIYQKLGVNGLLKALNRAKELKFIQ